MATTDIINENSFTMEITTKNKLNDTTTQPEIIVFDIVEATDFKVQSITTNELETTSELPESTSVPSSVTEKERDGKATTLDTKKWTTSSPEDATKLETTTTTNRRSNHPFIRYFRRLRKIYELDLKILDQIASLLEGINDEFLPQVADALEPLLISQTVNMLDLGQILGYVAQTIHSSSFQLGASTSLGGLDFLKFGK